MIVTEPRPSTLPPAGTTTAASTSGQQHRQPKRKTHHRHVGQLMLDFGKQAEVDRTGCSVVCTTRGGCIGSFHETAEMRQERLDSARRLKNQHHYANGGGGGGCRASVSRERSRSPQKQKQSPNRLSSSSTVTSARPQNPYDRTLAAIRIQRAYRAHRAVLILSNLERRVREAFDPSRDSRTALSYLRARSAEFAAMRTFMDATPHVSDNVRVEEMIVRVEETIRGSVERAEREERERETEATIVHVHGSGPASPTRSPTSPSRADAMRVFEKVHATNTKTCASSSGELPVRREMAANGVDITHTTSNVLRPGFIQNQKWITRLPTTNPPNLRRRRHSTVSKIPDLLTIPEDPEIPSSF